MPEGCALNVGDGCVQLQQFAGCLQTFCDKGNGGLFWRGGGLDGLSDASDYRKECQKEAAQIPSCPVDCSYEHCALGSHTALAVICWIILFSAIARCVYVRRAYEIWEACRADGENNPATQELVQWLGCLTCLGPFFLAITLAYSHLVSDSQLDVLYILACFLAVGLCAVSLLRQYVQWGGEDPAPGAATADAFSENEVIPADAGGAATEVAGQASVGTGTNAIGRRTDSTHTSMP